MFLRFYFIFTLLLLQLNTVLHFPLCTSEGCNLYFSQGSPHVVYLVLLRSPFALCGLLMSRTGTPHPALSHCMLNRPHSDEQ